MKAVMISIQPKWCEPIANGKKTIEVRKTKPKLETPFKCYIYCTKSTDMLWILNKKERAQFAPKIADIFKVKNAGGATNVNGKVIGEFVCEKTTEFYPTTDLKQLNPIHFQMCEKSCVDMRELYAYANSKKLYGWHISDLVIYDNPIELSEFKKHNRHCHYEHLGLAIPKCSECKGCQLERPPQSWCYVEEQT